MSLPNRDNTSWHKGKSLPWGRFKPVYRLSSPPYVLDLNPSEEFRLIRKGEWSINFAVWSRERLTKRRRQALTCIMNRGRPNKRTSRIPTKLRKISLCFGEQYLLSLKGLH